MYIILEYLLIENFIINLLILYITKIITKTKSNKYNLILGAIVGSLYSLVFFYPSLMFLSNFYMKFIISLILVKISFNSRSLKLFINEVLGFYIVSFIFAGATIGVFYTSNNLLESLYKPITIFQEFPVGYLILGILSASIVAKFLFTYHNNKVLKDNYLVDLKVFYKGESTSIKALIDTGNSLIEPFSKSPVLVIEYEKLKGILPPIMDELYKGEELNDFNLLEDTLRRLESEITIKLIPYKSVGNHNGILLGFKPDCIIMDYNNDSEIIRKDIIIGIYHGLLSQDSSYSGLLNYQIIKQEVVE